MPDLFKYWEAGAVLFVMFMCMALMSIGCGALVFWLASCFTPTMLACGAGASVFLFLLCVFFRMIRD